MPKFHFFSFLQYLYEMLRRFAASPHQKISGFIYHTTFFVLLKDNMNNLDRSALPLRLSKNFLLFLGTP